MYLFFQGGTADVVGLGEDLQLRIEIDQVLFSVEIWTLIFEVPGFCIWPFCKKPRSED